MKKKVLYIIVSIVFAAVLLAIAYSISWIMAAEKDNIDYSDTWISFRIGESVFENDVVNELQNIEVTSRKNIYYGLCCIAEKIDCEYHNKEKTIEFYVVQLLKGYHFSNIKFDTLVVQVIDGKCRETYICVTSNSKDDMAIVLSEMMDYMGVGIDLDYL